MTNRKARKDASRPAPHARLVYEDWVRGVRVRGYQREYGSLVSLTFIRVYSGSVLCTCTLEREWWCALAPKQQGEIKSSYVQKALASHGAVGSGPMATDADLSASCPALHEFLTLSVLPGGVVRQTSTLLVFTEGQLWKAVLNEREGDLSLWATAETLQGLWHELEARLTAPVVEWRHKRPVAVQNPSQGVDRRSRQR